MMISPELFRKMNQDKTIRECIEKRDSIYEYLLRFENDDIASDEYKTKPSPHTRYLMYLEYLIEIIDIIRIKVLKNE